MDPMPPLPAHAELRLPIEVPKVGAKEDDCTDADENCDGNNDSTGVEVPVKNRVPDEKKAPAEKNEEPPLDPESESSALFENLRQRRTELAKREGLAAYRILHDRSLRLMAQLRPQTVGDLLQVKGIGPQKLALYGAEFLAVIHSYTTADPQLPCHAEESQETTSTVISFPGPKTPSLEPFIDATTPKANYQSQIRPQLVPLPALSYSPLPFSGQLGSALKGLRIQLSRRLGMPQESIITDATIESLTRMPPKDTAQLYTITGIASLVEAMGEDKVLKFLARHSPVTMSVTTPFSAVEHMDLTSDRFS